MRLGLCRLNTGMNGSRSNIHQYAMQCESHEWSVLIGLSTLGSSAVEEFDRISLLCNFPSFPVLVEPNRRNGELFLDRYPVSSMLPSASNGYASCAPALLVLAPVPPPPSQSVL